MKIIVYIGTFLWAGAVLGQPWIPTECSRILKEKRAAFAQSMRIAQPGSPSYAPRPFPQNEAEVIENFKYGIVQQWKGKKAPDDQVPLLGAVEKNTVSFRILRVENWGPDRCSPDHQRDYFFLLYVKDSSTGKELSRFVLNQNGLVSQWTMGPAEEEKGEAWAAEYRAAVAPPLAEALSQVRSRFGITGTRAQYVTTWGQPRCSVVFPCIAFLAQGKYYLYRAGQLVEINSQSRSYSRAKVDATRTRYSEIVSSLSPENEWFVSVANERWVVAKRVKAIR